MFEYFGKGLNSNIFSEDFAKTAFNHFDRKSNGALTKYGYIEILEDFIVYLNSPSDKQNSLDSSKIEEVNRLLKRARETEPFASLPSEEKRLMDQIQTQIKSGASETDLAHTLNELKLVMLARHKEYQKIDSQNSWSIPLAIAGVFFTIFLGIWSVVLTIKKKRREFQHIYLRENSNTTTKGIATAESSHEN